MPDSNTAQKDSLTQGQSLGAVVADSALEHTVASYLIGVREILHQITAAARGLAEDGITLEQFADLIEGGDIV